MENVLKRAGISTLDWFRLAQNRKEWRKHTNEAFSLRKIDTSLSPGLG
jgi:hypothetical protein